MNIRLFHIYFVLLTSSQVCSQIEDTLFINPVWTVGEQKTIFINQRAIAYKNDSISNVEYAGDVKKILVTGVNSNLLLFSVFQQDPLFKVLKEMPYANLKSKFTDSIIEVEMIYDFRTREFEISNLNELFYSMDTLRSRILEDSDDLGAIYYQAMQLIFDQLIETFNSRKGINDYYLGDIKFLFTTYESTFRVKDTIYEIEKNKNPLSKNQYLTSNKSLYISNNSDDSLIIHQDIEINMDEFKKTMKSAVNYISTIAKSPRKVSKDGVEKIDKTMFGTLETNQITVDLNTAWVRRVRRQVNVYIKDYTDKIVSQVEIDTRIE
jgi:hypothetical protein